jgi:hypothetical protein
MPINFHISDDLKTLFIFGFHFDQIASTHKLVRDSFVESPWTKNEILEIVFAWCTIMQHSGLPNPYGGEKNRYGAFSRTLIADNDPHSVEMCSPAPEEYEAPLRFLMEFPRGDWIWKNELISKYLNAMASACNRKRFFLTNKGHMGIGPVDLKVGDSVSLINSGRLPCILRETGHSSYEFLGEA